MRYTIAHNGVKKVSMNVISLIKKEKDLGFDKKETYLDFTKNVNKIKLDLIKLLEKLKKAGKKVVAYGATSKSTTILTYSKIDKELIEYISDPTPFKQNKFSPGVHIPIKDYYSFSKNFPDYSILFAWNHKKEIFEKEKNYMQQGGKWINFVPKVTIE